MGHDARGTDRFRRLVEPASVSPAESIDAMKALAMSICRPRHLRDTLLLTLAKTRIKVGAGRELGPLLSQARGEGRDRARRCRRCKQRRARMRRRQTSEAGAPALEIGALAQMLMSQDRDAIAAEGLTRPIPRRFPTSVMLPSAASSRPGFSTSSGSSACETISPTFSRSAVNAAARPFGLAPVLRSML